MDFFEEQNENEFEDTQTNRFLIFDIENDSYGIEIKYVTEIIMLQ